jgi:Transglycosylase SLT domain/SPOR domain
MAAGWPDFAPPSTPRARGHTPVNASGGAALLTIRNTERDKPVKRLAVRVQPTPSRFINVVRAAEVLTGRIGILWWLALCSLLTSSGLALAAPEAPPKREETKTVTEPTQGAPAAVGSRGTESVQQALCRLIDASARAQRLPIDFFTRLIWQESSFRISAVSPAGAQGIAQFMPGTAVERGLLDPFDPEQAIPKSAELLRDHLNRFGNPGLAAAAYNGGPNRVANWLADRGGLPEETRTYVYRITGRSAEEWAEDRKGRGASENQVETESREEADRSENRVGAGKRQEDSAQVIQVEDDKGSRGKPSEAAAGQPGASCLQVVALLQRSGPAGRGRPGPGVPLAPLAPWGVQLAGNFSKSLALASYVRARQRYAGLLGEVRPMVIGTRLLSRGTRAFYRVRVPAPTRLAADQICNRIRQVGGACVVLPS